MDILDSAQKQINDAASQIDPQAVSSSNPPPEPSPTPITPSPEPPAPVVPPSVEPAAGLPKPEEPLKLKEEALLPEKSEVTPTPEPVVFPVTSPAPPLFAPIDVPDSKPTEPVRSTTFGAPPQKETPAPQSPPTSPPKKNGFSRGVLLAGLLLLLVALPIGIYYVSQQQQQITEQRSKAAGCISCPAGSCPDGFSYGADSCAPQATCAQRNAEACAGHGGGGGSSQGLPDAQSSGCCSSTGQCVGWFGAVSTCSNPNGACASGKQCKGSSCTPTHQCTNSDCGVSNGCGQTCNAGCPNVCGNGVCEANETNQNCPADCRPAGGGPTTCAPGKIICRKDNPSLCPNTNSSNPTYNAMVGVKCIGTSPGPNSACDFFDACAPAATGSCAGKTRLSCGGASHGGFVGCQGTLNCFCGPAPSGNNNVCDSAHPRGYTYTAADGNLNCFTDTDPNNPSCGASLAGGPTPTPPPSGGCKSDFCTSAADCAAKGGTVGTPATFASCSTGLVACCVNATPSPPPAGQCTRIKVYKNNVAVDPKTLKVGDSVTLAVAGTNATKGRIRVNGAVFVESTTLNTNGEYTVPFTIPAGIPSFTIEAEVFGQNGKWQ